MIVMNNEIKKQGKWKFRLVLSFCLILLVVVACEVSFHNLKIENEEGQAVTSVNAGDTAVFKYDLHIQGYDRNDVNERLVVAVLTPKVWDAKNNSRITLVAPSSNLGDEVIEFDPITTGTTPKGMTGVEWPEALKIWIKDDPNITDADMQWTAFISAKGANYSGATMWDDVKLTVKIKTSEHNVKCKVGFFAANNSNALEADMNGSLTSFNGWNYTECFEVMNGEGDLIDFCEMHYNSALPGSSTQNDILTFRFNAGIDDDPDYFLNELAYENKIYYNVTAYTKEGTQYTKKAEMTRNSEFGKTFSITYWPESFLGMDRSETLDRIEYYFSNEAGDKIVDYKDDQIQSGAIPKPGTEGDRPVEPFKFTVSCR